MSRLARSADLIGPDLLNVKTTHRSVSTPFKHLLELIGSSLSVVFDPNMEPVAAGPGGSLYDLQVWVGVAGAIASTAAVVVALWIATTTRAAEREREQDSDRRRARQVVAELHRRHAYLRVGDTDIPVPAVEIANGSDQAITRVEAEVRLLVTGGFEHELAWVWDGVNPTQVEFGYVLAGKARARKGRAIYANSEPKIATDDLLLQKLYQHGGVRLEGFQRLPLSPICGGTTVRDSVGGVWRTGSP